MSKILWIDVETGGLHPEMHALLEVGCIVEIDGVVEEEALFQIQPFPTDDLDIRAMTVNGITVQDIAGFMKPGDAFVAMHQMFDKYIDKYNPNDKLLPAGYNVEFDLEYLEAFWKKNRDQYLYSYLSHNTLDLLAVVRYLAGKDMLVLDNFKLATACAKFGISAGEHSALADAQATRKLSAMLDQWLNAGLVRECITYSPILRREIEKHPINWGKEPGKISSGETI